MIKLGKWLVTLMMLLSLALWASEDRGLGGTGKLLSGDDRGIGGTGKALVGDDRGLGGTGVIGTITEFGSIWVNGLEIELDAHTQIKMDGKPASEADLRLGQQVAVLATTRHQQWFAEEVDIYHSLIGQVESAEKGKWTIQGVQVVSADHAPGALFAAQGKMVKVSGYFQQDTLYATDIQPTSDTSDWQIRAPVTVQGNTWKVAGVELPNAMLDAQEGEVVTLRGRRSESVRAPNFIRHESIPFSGRADHYIIEKNEHGKGNQHPPQRISIDDLRRLKSAPDVRRYKKEKISRPRKEESLLLNLLQPFHSNKRIKSNDKASLDSVGDQNSSRPDHKRDKGEGRGGQGNNGNDHSGHGGRRDNHGDRKGRR